MHINESCKNVECFVIYGIDFFNSHWLSQVNVFFCLVGFFLLLFFFTVKHFLEAFCIDEKLFDLLI